MKITYRNHKGQTIDFGEGAINYFKHGLFDYEWTYLERNGHIAAFNKPIQEKSFPVGIFADTEEGGRAARNAIYEVADVDVMNMKPGALVIGEWELSCYILRSQADMYWLSDRICEFELTVVTEKPNWVRQRTVNYSYEVKDDSDSEFLNFPYNFPYNFTRKWAQRRVINEALAPCDFILRVYGAAEDPYVVVADNRYEVEGAIPNGSRLEINSREQTIQIIDSVGRTENVYDARKLGKVGSGHYIFEKIPIGYSPILWSKEFSFDLVLFEERGVPEWAA